MEVGEGSEAGSAEQRETKRTDALEESVRDNEAGEPQRST